MYKKVETNLNFVEREKDIIEFWSKENVFEKSVKNTEGGEEFCFYDGPPTANGKPHIGHVLTRVMKDIIPRYQTMKGKHVLRKAGWDTHGLPVELEIEKKLGLDGKQDIEKFGIEPFIEECKKSVWKYSNEWKTMSERLGFWVDMENPYVTYHDDYIESVWWSLKKIWEKGLLYKGHKIVPYCPRCGTALASHEVAQGYKDVKEKSVFVKFKLKNENKYFLAWTTTPWTLPSNVALCMNANENYCEIEADGVKYILAEALAPSLFEDYKTVSVKKGSEYLGVEYEPLYPFAKDFKEKAYYIVNDDYVTLTDGTGIVHIAPAFGVDDAKVGTTYKLPFVQLVDDRGRFKEEATLFKGIFVKDADKLIIEDLKSRELLFKEMLYEHSYPFCWRCNTPLLYYARSSWFIKMTEVKERLIAANDSVNWMPETIKSGRMGNFLENVIDWGLSRERYWGTPLPVWQCGECGHTHVIGSKKELQELCGCGEVELHRPFVDKLEFSCPHCGKPMRRVKEVIDCWYDSGSMPFAQFHYPFENKELFEKHFPADFISEAIDQTRGWFYVLLAISTLLFDKAAFKNCIVLGHVNDEKGLKMSKHIGNVVDPWTILDKQGSDAVRWYFYTTSAPWLPSRFYEKAVSECQAKYMGTLWNAYAFFVLYADIDKFNPAEHNIENCSLTIIDKWILSKLNSLIKTVDQNLNEYKTFESARLMQSFVDELSNWYIRRCRERYWGSGMDADKEAAYVTLYTVLERFSRLTAPFTPFIAESIYQNLVPAFFKNAPASVHLTSFPTYEEKYIDAKLEEDMEEIENIVVLGRAARNSSSIKNRQPLSKLYYSFGKKIDFSDELLSIAKDELNIKSLQAIDDSTEFISYSLKPQLKTLGPKYGKHINDIRKFLAECDTKKVVDAVSSGVYKVNLNGEEIELSAEDLLVTTLSKEGFVAASENGKTVVLDINLTEELIFEGLEREVVSRLQTMRKEAGFLVTDRIRVCYKAEGKLDKVLTDKTNKISSIVLADSITKTDNLIGYQKEWNINGDDIVLSVEKV